MKRCSSSAGFSPGGSWLRTALLGMALALLPLAANADPTISGVSASPVTSGSFLAIHGSGFGTTQGQSTVMLGQHFLPVTAWTNNAITAYLTPTSLAMGPGESPMLVVV